MRILKKSIKILAVLILFFNPFHSYKASATKEFVVVSFDGGGTRGAAVLIEVIRKWQEASGHNFQSDVHMIFGTSIGGILGLALAAGFDIQDCYDLLVLKAPDILKESYLEELTHLGGVLTSKYPSEPLETELKGLFGDRTLANITGMYVGATTWNTETEQPIYLTNWDYMGDIPGLPGSSGGTKPIWEAARQTGAAPTYWDACEGCIDGGVFANNPASIAYTLACDLQRRGIQHGILDPDKDSSVVKLYSFGTGVTAGNSHHASHILDSNLVHQAVQIVNIATNVVATEKEMAVRCKACPERYYRFSPLLPREVPLDCKDISLLEDVATWTQQSLAEWDRWSEFEASLASGPRYSYGLPDVELLPPRTVGASGGTDPLDEE